MFLAHRRNGDWHIVHAAVSMRTSTGSVWPCLNPGRSKTVMAISIRQCQQAVSWITCCRHDSATCHYRGVEVLIWPGVAFQCMARHRSVLHGDHEDMFTRHIHTRTLTTHDTRLRQMRRRTTLVEYQIKCCCRSQCLYECMHGHLCSEL